MRAALRYRGGQAVALALLAALVTACATLAPLFTRSVEQALLRAEVMRADPAATALQVAVNRTPDQPGLTPSDLAERVPGPVRALHDDPVGALVVTTETVPREGRKPSPGRLVARDRVCEHLRLAAGRCPAGALEVAVSSADAAAWGWQPGRVLRIPAGELVGATDASDGAAGSAMLRLRVVGVYEVVDDPGYWLGHEADGRSGVPVGVLDPVPALDDLITAPATFEGRFPRAAVTLHHALDRDRLDIDDLPAALAALDTVQVNPEAEPEEGGIRVEVPVRSQLAAVRAGQEQVALVVPVVMIQVGLLAVVVLLLAAAAAVEQRRGEVALARLRGRSRAQTRRLVVGELALTVLLGLPVGVLVALGLNEALRRGVLPDGVPFEVRPDVLWWVLGALLVSLGAVALAARPVLQEPVGALLRRVPGRVGRARLGAVELVVVVLAVLGVAGLATGALAGTASLATPALLGLALGLLAGRALTLLAAGLGARATRSGRVVTALAALALARRPATARVVTVVCVATGLTVFGANAVVVADADRQSRAELEIGAPTVLVSPTQEASVLVDAAAAARDAGLPATPVVVVRPRLDARQAVMAVDPETFGAVAYGQVAGAPLRLDALAGPSQQTVALDGERVTGRIRWQLSRAADEGTDGRDVAPRRVSIRVTTPDGSRLERTLAELGPQRSGTVAVDAPLLCPEGCRLDALAVRLPEATTGEPVAGTLVVEDLAVDGTALPVTDASTWTAGGPETGEGVLRPASSGSSSDGSPGPETSGQALRLEVEARDGADLVTRVTDVPETLPAITAGDELAGGTPSRLGVNGLPVALRSVQSVPALPSLGRPGVLVALPTQLPLGGRLPADQGSAQVWLGTDDPTAVSRAQEVLAEHGVTVAESRAYAERKRLFDDSASGWGLRLALVAGLLALPLALLVLVVVAVAGWRGTTRDLAALVVSGVPRRVAARALRREQVTAVGVGLVAGTVAGVTGSLLALPVIPFFSTPSAAFTPVVAPSPVATAAAALVAGLALLPGAWLVARALARRVRPELVQESA